MIPYIYLIIPSYSLLAFIGGFASIIYVYIRNMKYQIELHGLLRTAIVEIICVFLGARILFFITQIPTLIYNFSLDALIDSTINGGLVFYGGLFGGILGLNISARMFKLDKDMLVRVVAPCFPLFHAFGRIGCFLTGCCYGKLLSSPVNVLGVSIERVPTQLIEAFCEFAIFIFIAVYDKKFGEKANVLKTYLLTYSVCRFIIEFVRGDTVRGIFFGISTAQWICIAIWCCYIIKAVKQAKAAKLGEVNN